MNQKANREFLKELSKEIGKESLEKWLSRVLVREDDNQQVVLSTPNQFTLDWIKRNYQTQLLKAAKTVWGTKTRLQLEVNPELPTETGDALDPSSQPSARRPAPSPSHPTLNGNYTFDNFVVGPSNQFAHAACKAVAERKARNYNPLFIYGGVGLGKTHLLNAVGNELIKRGPKLKILCLQAESFMNDMIRAIRGEQIDKFRNLYRRDCDVILMDDIEILAGKERTQEEFFYTFNELHNAGKKIIITSDKFPKEMTTLEERLRSRFESGIIVDIQPPEFETRIAILKRKAENEGLKIPDEVITHLAEKIRTNVRKLEGALIRLSALSSLSGSPLNIELADQVVSALLTDGEERLSAEMVMKTVASFYKIKVSDLKSPKRNRKFALPRQIAMHLCRELCHLSYPEIGASFGGRDHSTVIHSCRKIGVGKNTDLELNKHLETIKRQLGA